MPLYHKCSNKLSMENIYSRIELKKMILLLEQQQTEEELLLKEQLLLVAEGLKPANIIKSTFLDLSKSHDMKDSLINSSLGIAAGYVSKKVVFGAHPSPLKQALAMLLQIGISSMVASNSENIKSGLAQVFNLFSSKKETAE